MCDIFSEIHCRRLQQRHQRGYDLITINFYDRKTPGTFKRWSVSVEELSADGCPRGNLMFLKQIFAREAKLRGQIC